MAEDQRQSPPDEAAVLAVDPGHLEQLERRLREQANEIASLRHEQRLYELITNQMCDGLSVIDQHFVIRDANDAFVRHYGGDRGRIVGRTCHEVTHGSPVPCAGADHICPVIEARRTGTVCRVEHLHRSEQGAEAIVEVTAIPVPREAGEPELVVEVAHDITDRRRAEREAAERQRVEGMLAATGAACHHLNQPTQTLLLGFEQLRRRASGLESVGTLVDTLQAEVERIAHITRRLQHVARCVTVSYYHDTNILDLGRSSDAESSPPPGAPSAPGDAGAESPLDDTATRRPP